MDRLFSPLGDRLTAHVQRGGQRFLRHSLPFAELKNISPQRKLHRIFCISVLISILRLSCFGDSDRFPQFIKTEYHLKVE